MPAPDSSAQPLTAAEMKQWPLWMSLVVLVAGAAVGSTYLIEEHLGARLRMEHQGHSLRIMTWNIGKLYLSWESRAADRDLDHIAEVIREVDPAVVALQELTGPEQLGRLVTILGPRWRASVAEDDYDRRAGLLVRLPAVFHALSTSTGRIAQAATIELDHGDKLVIASVHLDAFDPLRRLSQAEEILAGAERIAPSRIVLAGDFNFDAGVAATGSADQRLYSFLTTEMVDAGKEAGATTVVSRRLDYVFLRSPDLARVSARVLRDKRINIMDHDPLLVELMLGE